MILKTNCVNLGLLEYSSGLSRMAELDDELKLLAKDFADKEHALYLGRGDHYPIALEGALKLKEITYIHAEAYPAGELKHGPLALVDENMPVVAVAPNDSLTEKLVSNIAEVKARGGRLIVIKESKQRIGVRPEWHLLKLLWVAIL